MRLFLIIIIPLFQLVSSAQGFRSRYIVPQASQALTKDIFEISPGNYIGTGYCTDTSTGFARTQLVLTGLNAQGEVQWVKKHHGGPIEYQGNSFIARTFYKKGNFIYYAGCAYDSAGGNGRQFGVFIKYNLNGDTLWRKIYRNNDTMEDIIPQMVTMGIDGGFLLTGFFQHWGNHTRPCLVMKTDANGNELWRKRINKTGTNVSDGKAIIQDSATKKIVVVGYQYIGGSNVYPNILILDSVGNKLYQGKFYNEQGADALDLVQTSDKKFVMVGRKAYTHVIEMPEMYRAVAIKFDINAPSIPIWISDSVATLNNDDAYSSGVALPNGDIALGGVYFPIFEPDGVTYSQMGAVSRLTIMGSNGKIKSNKYYSYYPPEEGIQSYLWLSSFSHCSDGAWVAAIASTKFPGPNPLFFVKYDSTGCDSTVVYCAMINSGILESPLHEARFNIFPNPAQNVISVFNNSDFVENAEMILLDINGRELKKTILLNENSIPVAELSPGLYFLKIQQNGRLVYTTKFVKE